MRNSREAKRIHRQDHARQRKTAHLPAELLRTIANNQNVLSFAGK